VAEPAAHGAAWTPANGNLDNGGQITLGVRLINKTASPVDIGGVAFYAPVTTGGTYTASVWQTTASDDSPPGAGTLLDDAAVAAAGITPAAWNYFDVPLTLQPGVVYTAGVHTSTGRYVSNGADSLIAAIEGDDIRLIAANSDPNPPGLGSMFNGVFRDAANGYPVSAFQRTDYGIDVWLADAIEPIDVAGAITVGEVVVAGAAQVQLRATGAIPVGEVQVSGALVQLTPVSVIGAVVIGEVVVAGAATHPVTERPPGFESLTAMFRDAKRHAGQRVRATECTYDGWPLESGRGVLHCGFCGRTY
jgi:hypothetical protein